MLYFFNYIENTNNKMQYMKVSDVLKYSINTFPSLKIFKPNCF